MRESEARAIADQQGWTDRTLLDLLFNVVENADAEDEMISYLAAVAEEENAYSAVDDEDDYDEDDEEEDEI